MTLSLLRCPALQNLCQYQLDDFVHSKPPHSSESQSCAFPEVYINPEMAQIIKHKRQTVKGLFSDVHKSTMELGNQTRKIVAVKWLRYPPSRGNHWDREREKRFVLQVHALISLNHANVCEFKGLWRDNGIFRYGVPGLVSTWVPHAVMDYLEGNSDRSQDMVMQAAEGLHYLHLNGVVHGNMKTSNIRVDDSGTAKLLDFGLYALHSDTTPALNGCSWSARYVAPELLASSRNVPTFQSDVFSFGMTILQLLHGRDLIPFPGGRVFDRSLPYNHVLSEGWGFLKVIIEDQNRPHLDKYRNVSHLESLLKDCWHHEPRQRPSMGYVISKLEPRG